MLAVVDVQKSTQPPRGAIKPPSVLEILKECKGNTDPISKIRIQNDHSLKRTAVISRLKCVHCTRRFYVGWEGGR